MCNMENCLPCFHTSKNLMKICPPPLTTMHVVPAYYVTKSEQAYMQIVKYQLRNRNVFLTLKVTLHRSQSFFEANKTCKNHIWAWYAWCQWIRRRIPLLKISWYEKLKIPRRKYHWLVPKVECREIAFWRHWVQFKRDTKKCWYAFHAIHSKHPCLVRIRCRIPLRKIYMRNGKCPGEKIPMLSAKRWVHYLHKVLNQSVTLRGQKVLM